VEFEVERVFLVLVLILFHPVELLVQQEFEDYCWAVHCSFQLELGLWELAPVAPLVEQARLEQLRCYLGIP
jgi:hypothetical protein